MNPVPVGPSTVALIIAALSAAAAFVVAWAESGSAPAWLAGLAAGLTALLGLLRSWQAVRSNDVPPSVEDDLVVDDPPEVSKDYAG